MNQEHIIKLFHDAITLIIIISTPLLLSVLLSGLLVSIFQAATQINEQTLSFIPKIISIFISGSFFGPWMLKVFINYIHNLFHMIPIMIKS